MEAAVASTSMSINHRHRINNFAFVTGALRQPDTRLWSSFMSITPDTISRIIAGKTHQDSKINQEKEILKKKYRWL